VAVSQGSNRQKSDQDVTTWIVPDHPSQRCRYLSDQVAIKLAWELSMDAADQAAMRRIAEKCPDTDVTVNPVPCPERRARGPGPGRGHGPGPAVGARTVNRRAVSLFCMVGAVGAASQGVGARVLSAVVSSVPAWAMTASR
jgi:hypothetical protein